MRISVGARIQPGPFGGGNQFAKLLVDHLQRQGHAVSHDLRDPHLDLILLMEPRRLRFSAYSDRHVWRYLLRRPQTLVVHRVNECDERKGVDRGVNARLARANLCVDHTVFVSSWLRDLHLARGWPCASTSVVLNGSDTDLFHPRDPAPWDGQGPLRLVTHHWGNSWQKGFDIYQRLDEMMARPEYAGRLEFTYIGKLPPGFAFEHARYVEPLSGEALADALRAHHVYVTASRNEPGSNHQNEGALCGLPLLYLENASMPEYCDGFGLSFQPETFEARLAEMMARYGELAARMGDYPHTSERLIRDWDRELNGVLARRDALLAARPGGRAARWLRETLRAGVRRYG